MPPLSLLLAVLTSIAPGIYAWATGRRLLALIDDPIFPERHFARSRELWTVTIIASIVAPVLAGGALWLTLPVLLFALLAGSFPARRRIYEERWSFATYLRFMFFSGVGMIGFWMLLILAPGAIAGLAAVNVRGGGVAAVIIALILIAWQLDHPRVWLALHRATPVERPDLAPLFDAIITRAKCPRPGIYQVGEPGGHVMNAIALPHSARPAVAFGTTALERLTPRELAAVFAHEIAHLEYYDARRLRRMGLASTALIVLATAVTTLIAARWSGLAMWLSLGVMLATVLTLGTMMAKSQANETASDLRAIELAGEPDALIDALTRLHLDLRLPRQWPHELERRVSHPSLARRIQAIRECAHVAGPALGRTTIARTPAGNVRIALDETRTYWFEGIPTDLPEDLASMREQASSYRALAYSELSELRLVPAGSGKALKARDLSGKAWMVSLRPEDVPAVQRALEVVDARLGQARRERSSAGAQLLACAMLVALFMAGQIGLVLVPLLIALVRPSPAAMAALGAVALARLGAVLTAGDHAGASPIALAGLAAMTVIAAIAIWHAWRGARMAERRDNPRPTVLALGGAAVIFAVQILLDGEGAPIGVLVASAPFLSFSVALLGLAAALTTAREQRWRRAGIAATTAAAVLTLVGAGASARALGTTLATTTAVGHVAGSMPVEQGSMRLELSPSGSRFAVLRSAASGGGYDGESVRLVWSVGAIGGETRDIEAIDLWFVDDERVLVLGWQADSVEVRMEHVGADPRSPRTSMLWRRRFELLAPPQLVLDRGDEQWTLAGRLETGELAAFVGSLSGAMIAQRTWPADSTWSEVLHVNADGSLLLQTLDIPRGYGAIAMGLLRGGSLRYRLWRLTEGERTPIGRVEGMPQCRAVDRADVVCALELARRPRVFRIADGRALEAVGRLPAGFDFRNVGTGAVFTAIGNDGERVLVVDPVAGTATRVMLEPSGDTNQSVLLDARGAGGMVAALWSGTGGARLVAYRIE